MTACRVRNGMMKSTLEPVFQGFYKKSREIKGKIRWHNERGILKELELT